ncbi:hypothetical protein RIF29_26386 [Crotalaria pallida]|uniref:Uncharacterized protein n=1 Tax=Crotalaria pallida TaxID=3830 RepID=A0AAN9ESN2_CROPI
MCSSCRLELDSIFLVVQSCFRFHKLLSGSLAFSIDPTLNCHSADSLKNYPRHTTAVKLQMQEMEQLANVQGLPTDRYTLNKLMAMHSGLNNKINSNHSMGNRGALSGLAEAAVALTNCQNIFTRQNSMNSNSMNSESIFRPRLNFFFIQDHLDFNRRVHTELLSTLPPFLPGHPDARPVRHVHVELPKLRLALAVTV